MIMRKRRSTHVDNLILEWQYAHMQQAATSYQALSSKKNEPYNYQCNILHNVARMVKT